MTLNEAVDFVDFFNGRCDVRFTPNIHYDLSAPRRIAGSFALSPVGFEEKYQFRDIKTALAWMAQNYPELVAEFLITKSS